MLARSRCIKFGSSTFGHIAQSSFFAQTWQAREQSSFAFATHSTEMSRIDSCTLQNLYLIIFWKARKFRSLALILFHDLIFSASATNVYVTRSAIPTRSLVADY